MPSRAATSALAFAATCCMLDTNTAFLQQAPTMSTSNNNNNNNNYWGKKKNDAHNKVPTGGAIGFGQSHVLPPISGFAAGNVVHLPRVPSAQDHAAQRRSRASSCPPLELGIFDVFQELSEAIEEFEELALYGGGTLNEAWVDSDEEDTDDNELKDPDDVQEPQSVTIAGKKVMVEEEEEEEEGGGNVGGSEKEKGKENGVAGGEEERVVDVAVVEKEKKGPLSWFMKRVLGVGGGGGRGGGGGVPAVPEHEWPLPGLVAVEGGSKKRPPMPDTQVAGWLDNSSDQHSLMVIRDPGIVHKVLRDPSCLRERSKEACLSSDSSSSSSSSSSEVSSPEDSSTKKSDDAAAGPEPHNTGETDDKTGGCGGGGGGGGGGGEEGGPRVARKAGQTLKRWWGGATRRRLR